MLGLRTWGLLSASMLIAGCSVHPLPKDVSQQDTSSIVRNIRCEAKFKVIDRVRDLLQQSPIPEVRAMSPIKVLDDKNLLLIKARHPAGDTYRDRYGALKTHKDLAAIFTVFRSSVIGYDFDFLITEKNDKSGNANFRLPFTGGGLFKFGFGGELNKIRAANRKFLMQETFEDLTLLRCREDSEFFEEGQSYKPIRKRLIYPLTGSVSMNEIMGTFLDLGALGGGKPGTTFTDELTFTTILKGDVGGDVSITSAPQKKFRLATADAALAASRSDVHKVTITLAFPAQDHRNPQQLVGDASERTYVESRTLELVALQSCIQSGKNEEIALGTLREYAPEQYCPGYAARVTDLRLGSPVRRGLESRQPTGY